MKAPPKKKGCLAGQPKRSAPAKVQIATGEGIPIPARHKRILRRANKFLCNALATLCEINNNVARGEIRFYAANTAALKRNIDSCRRLGRGLSAVAVDAKRWEAQ